MPRPAKKEWAEQCGSAVDAPSLRIRPRCPVGDEVRRIALELVRAAAHSLDDASGSGAAEATHEARKRFKELRALLRLADGTDHAAELTLARHELRDAGRCLAAARDAVSRMEAIEALDARPDSAAAPLLDRLREVLRVVRVPPSGVDAALDLLAAATGRIEGCTFLRCDRAAVERNVRRSFNRARRAMARAMDSGSPAGYHEWRKRTKEQWYHARMAGAHLPALAAREPELRRLAQLLGDHHDLVVLSGVAVRYLDGATAVRLLSLADQRMRELEWDAGSIGLALFARDGIAEISPPEVSG